MERLITGTIEHLIFPPGFIILLLLFGLLLAKHWTRTALGLSVSALLLLYACSIPIVSSRLMMFLQSDFAPLSAAASRAGAQAIVVLTGGRDSDALEYGGESVSHYTLVRIRYAAHLHRQTGLPILISGGSVKGEPVSEASLAREALADSFRVVTQWIEDGSRNTWENAQLAAQTLREAGIERAYLVTHAWHMRRATQAFANTDLAIIPAPTAFVVPALGAEQWLPASSALHQTTLALHELVGMLWYRLRY
ncbi:MAG: hypothetical protein AMJ69_08895 [Gammaproteobacteria bacterium SG8_47]|nr:MAG: hypothetical protein AMJ69_08895 [Gammaproteobacteria bacterium SG8_47]